MTVIHAYRRVKKTTHEYLGINYTFTPNELGDVVCDVKEEPAVERFLSITTAFKLYERAAAPVEPVVTISTVLTAAPAAPQVSTATAETASPLMAAAAKVASDATQVPQENVANPDPSGAPPADIDKFVLVDGETRFDLKPLADAQLREFATANSIKVPKALEGDDIRALIVKRLSAAKPE